MKSTVLFVGLLTVFGSALASPAQLNERAACNGDNCLNAVKKASAVNTKDCQSFMTRTVTPCPYSTTTTTTTTTVTKTVGSAPHNKRGEAAALEARFPAVTSAAAAACPTSTTATAPPTYASACSGAVRYSSACTCLGVTTGTTTISSPLATYTVTSTSASTVTAVCSTFNAKATSGTYAGQYLAFAGLPDDSDSVVAFRTNVTQADKIVLANVNHFYGSGGNASRVWRSYTGLSYVQEGTSDNENVNPKMNCTLSAISLNGAAKISCITTPVYDGGSTTFQTCPDSGDVLYIGKGVYDGGESGPEYACTALDLITIPLC